MPSRLRSLAGAFVVALVVCVLVGSLAETPGAWSVRATDVAIPASRTQVMRGEALRTGDEIVLVRGDPHGLAVVSTTTDFASTEYPRVVWSAIGIPDGVSVSLLWSTDLEPSRLNSIPIDIRAGRAMPVNVMDQQHWIGHITGLALAFHGDLRSSIRIGGLSVRAGGLVAALRRVTNAWVGFAPWSMTSVTSLETRAAMPDISPVALLVASVVATLVLLVGKVWLREGNLATIASFGSAARACVPALVILTLLAWLILDVGWTAGLARHVHDDNVRFAGKTPAEKHLALEDGALFAFAEKARAMLPPIAADASPAADARVASDAPATSDAHTASAVPAASDAPVASDATVARVFVVADSDYLRGRAAYLLYPWNVWTDRTRNAVPPADQLHRGDWIVVYQRRGVEYDAATRHLRWDGGKVLDADLRLLDHGGALFEVR